MANIKYLSNVTLDATPTEDTDLVTKGYVDKGLKKKAEKSHAHNQLSSIGIARMPDIGDTNTYLIAQESVAPKFLTATTYSVGDYCTHDGNFYKCATDHQGSWSAGDFTKATVKDYIDDVASEKADATHTHSGSDITSGTISTSYLPAADGTSAGIVSVATNSGLVASSGALSVNVTDGNGLSKNATTGAITVRSASTSAYGTVRIASSVASDSSYVVPSSLLYSTLQNYVPTSDLTTTGGSGQNGKVVQLNSNGLIDTTMVPKIAVTDTFTASSESQMTGLTEAEQGDICIRTDLSKTFILTNNTPGTASNWKELATPADTVTSVNTKTGAVTLTASDVGAAGSNHVHASLKNGATLFSPWLTENTHAVNMGKIAPKFSESQAYVVGDLCYRNDVFYRCSTAHPAGAWDASHFTSTNIKAYIDDGLSGKSNTDHTHYYLKNGNHTATAPTLTVSTYVVIQDKITPSYDSTVTYSLGDTCSRYGRFFRWINANSGSNHAPISAASGSVDSTYWEEITIFGYVDHVADGLGIAEPFDSTKTYSEGERCIYRNKLYRRNDGPPAPGVDTTPTNAAFWDPLSLGDAAFYDVSELGEYNERGGSPCNVPVLLERLDNGRMEGTLPETCVNVGVTSISIDDASETLEDWMESLENPKVMFASGQRYYDEQMGLGTYVYCDAENASGAVDHLFVKLAMANSYFTELALAKNVYASLATPYDYSTTYSEGDICSYNGQLYKWTNNSSGSDTAPSDTTYWTAITVIDGLNSAISSHTHSGSDITSGTISASYLPTASTSASGIVQLASSIASGGTGIPTAGTVYSFVNGNYSATSHTHDRLKSGNYEAYLPNLTTGTRLVVQEKIAPEYNGSTTYSKGDPCCLYGRLFQWINNTSGSGHPPVPSHSGSVDTTYWEEIKVTGYINNQDANLRASLLTENIAETYSSSKTYNYGDICSYNGQIYIWANGASGSNHLPTDTDYWSEAVVMDSVDIKMSEHTHSSLKNGSYTVSAPAVSSASYVVAQESIVPIYNNTTSYSTGNICSYNGKIYRYKYSTSSSAKLPTNTTYWEETTVKAYVDTGLSGKANSTHSHAGSAITSGTVSASYLPTATTSAKGIVQVGSGLSVSNGVVSVDPSSVNAIMGMGVYTKLANLSTPTVALADDTALYKYTIAGNTTLTFDSSNLTMTSGTAITFELYLVMPATVYTVSFPNTVSWLNNETPSMSTKSKTYMLTFRSIDGGATWLGSKEGCY